MTMPRCSFTMTLALCSLFACDDEPGAKDRPELDREGPQYAVLSGDFTATSISLLDGAGKVVADDYINSGSTESGLVTALSGDVDLPTRSGEDGVLVLIDRFKTDVITRVQLSDGKVLGQVKTHTPNDQDSKTAFSSNPHDYVRIDEHTAWVTRNQPNLDNDAPEIDRGNDLLKIDPSTMERTEDRIDLSALDGRATRTNPDTGKDEEVEIYAHPSRMTRLGKTLLVGLGRNAYDFSAIGSGKIAIVDTESGAVTGLDLEGLQGCSQVSPIPGSEDRVLVGCSGDYNNPGQTEGVAVVRVTGGKASVVASWTAKDHPDAPALSGSFTAIDAETITAAANAFVPGGDDSVFGTLDLDSGAFETLLTIPAGNTFGSPQYDATAKKLYVPDASADSDLRPTSGVRVLTLGKDGFDEGDVIEVAEDTGMPARGVYPL